MTLEAVIEKAETYNLMMSDVRSLGGGTVMLDLVFASSCLADQFGDWADSQDMSVEQDFSSAKVTVWGW